MVNQNHQIIYSKFLLYLHTSVATHECVYMCVCVCQCCSYLFQVLDTSELTKEEDLDLDLAEQIHELTLDHEGEPAEPTVAKSDLFDVKFESTKVCLLRETYFILNLRYVIKVAKALSVQFATNKLLSRHALSIIDIWSQGIKPN